MKEFLSYIISKDFLKQVLYISIFLLLVLLGVLFWLRSYTNHGQKLEMHDYTNVPLEKAITDALEMTFEIKVTDSTHIVGKPGGIILDQNPPAGSMVKENRKIYVTTTKYKPDELKVKDLPLLYGTEYDQAVSDLKSRFIYSEVKSRKYDPGQPNHILEVYYNGKLIIDRDIVKENVTIEKGGKLSFVISERRGGSFPIPKLVCKSLADAKSYMLYSKLSIGSIKEDGKIENPEEAYISSQYPKSDGVSELAAGSIIDLIITAKKPANCN